MANEKNEIKMKYALKDLVGVAEIFNNEPATSVWAKLPECGYTEQEAYDIWTIASYGYDMQDPFPRELLVQYRKTREKLIEEKQRLFGRLYGYDPNNSRDAEGSSSELCIGYFTWRRRPERVGCAGRIFVPLFDLVSVPFGGDVLLRLLFQA